MKTCAQLLAVLLPTLASAQSFSIDRHVAAGGGTSTGGGFTVSGTIGQVDAGPILTAGSYSLIGGFWAFPTAVQTPGAPTLLISPAGPNQAVISWSLAVSGFVLQEASSASGNTWTTAPTGTANPVVVPLSLPAKFYRLSRE